MPASGQEQCRQCARRGPKITPHRQQQPWQRGSRGNNDPINTAARGLFLDFRNTQHAAGKLERCRVCRHQPTKLVSPAWGVGAQQARLETWQPGSSQFSL